MNKQPMTNQQKAEAAADEICRIPNNPPSRVAAIIARHFPEESVNQRLLEDAQGLCVDAESSLRKWMNDGSYGLSLFIAQTKQSIAAAQSQPSMEQELAEALRASAWRL